MELTCFRSYGTSKCVRRRSSGALGATEHLTDGLRSALRGYDPRSVLPWWIVPNVLSVAALELRYPVALSILVKADDASSYRLHVSANAGVDLRASNHGAIGVALL